MTNQTKIRGTIASAPNLLVLVCSTAAFLAEKGATAAAQSVSANIGQGKLQDALDLATKAIRTYQFGDIENPIDTDGQSVYVGMHPFKQNTFGIYRTELRDQHKKNSERRSKVDSTKAEREKQRAEAKANKEAKAKARAQKALEKAEKARARAEKIAAKYNLNLTDSNASAGAESDSNSTSNQGVAATV